ncbi:unnamed protein product [Rotaria sp. Silwood2]|nr:unnamed protein product [Rotaria sp. Silwood2]
MNKHFKTFNSASTYELTDLCLRLCSSEINMKRTFSGDEFDTNADGLVNSNSQMTDITKKSRSEPALPSRVVHLRNIEASELEVVQLGLPFGRVTNFLNLRKKAQAFLEFDATDSAKQMVDYFTSMPAMLNGRQVFAQFSNHGELRTDPTNRTNQQAHVALVQATDLYETAQKGGPNCVLRVSIINMLFPVTIDVLYQNSVMDDNKLLTLANEERIHLQDYCSLLFEVGDLKYASAATVSRCGMIYVDPENLDQLELYSDKIHAIFLQAFILSFGVCLKQEDRIVLDIFIKYLSGLSTVSIDLKAKSGQLPNEKLLLFDYIFQPELDQCIKWNDLILKYENDRSKRFTELLVPTINTIRLEWLIKSMIIIHQPVLFVGDTESSKTATILSYIDNFGSQYISLI